MGPYERLASDKHDQIGNDEGSPLRSLAITVGREARLLGSLTLLSEPGKGLSKASTSSVYRGLSASKKKQVPQDTVLICKPTSQHFQRE